MADSSVLLEVIVEGKNIKLVQRDVEELGASINKATAAEEKQTKQKKKSKKATDDLNNGVRNYNRGQKGVAQATANGTKAFSKQRDAIGSGSSGLVGAYATIAANLFAATAAFGALRRAAQVDTLIQGVTALGAASGQNIPLLAENLKDATGAAISLDQALRTASFASSSGFDAGQIEQLAEVGKKAAIALGRDVGDAVDRLTRGVAKLEPEILDELGIIVRLDDATASYAAQIGKTANQLTAFERQQAFANATIEQGLSKFGQIDVDPNPYDQLAASLQDIANTALALVNTVFGPLISILAENKLALTSLVLVLTKGVAAQAAASFGTLSKSAADAAAKTAAEAKKAAKAQKKAFKETKKELSNIPDELSKVAREYSELAGQAKSYDDLIEQEKALTKTIEKRTKALSNANRTAAGIEKSKGEIGELTDLRGKVRTEIGKGKAPSIDPAVAENLKNITQAQAGIFQSLDEDPSFENFKNKFKEAKVLGKDYADNMNKAGKANFDFLTRLPLIGGGLGGVSKGLKAATLAFFTFGTAGKVAIRGIVYAVPIIGQVLLVLSVAFEILKGIASKISDLLPPASDLTKAQKAVADTTETLKSTSVAYEKAIIANVEASTEYVAVLSETATEEERLQRSQELRTEALRSQLTFIEGQGNAITDLIANYKKFDQAQKIAEANAGLFGAALLGIKEIGADLAFRFGRAFDLIGLDFRRLLSGMEMAVADWATDSDGQLNWFAKLFGITQAEIAGTETSAALLEKQFQRTFRPIEADALISAVGPELSRAFLTTFEASEEGARALTDKILGIGEAIDPSKINEALTASLSGLETEEQKRAFILDLLERGTQEIRDSATSSQNISSAIDTANDKLSNFIGGLSKGKSSVSDIGSQVSILANELATSPLGQGLLELKLKDASTAFKELLNLQSLSETEQVKAIQNFDQLLRTINQMELSEKRRLAVLNETNKVLKTAGALNLAAYSAIMKNENAIATAQKNRIQQQIILAQMEQQRQQRAYNAAVKTAQEQKKAIPPVPYDLIAANEKLADLKQQEASLNDSILSDQEMGYELALKQLDIAEKGVEMAREQANLTAQRLKNTQALENAISGRGPGQTEVQQIEAKITAAQNAVMFAEAEKSLAEARLAVERQILEAKLTGINAQITANNQTLPEDQRQDTVDVQGILSNFDNTTGMAIQSLQTKVDAAKENLKGTLIEAAFGGGGMTNEAMQGFQSTFDNANLAITRLGQALKLADESGAGTFDKIKLGIGAARETMAPMFEDLKAMGPDGELAAAIGEGALNITDAFATIASKSADMADKLAAVGAIVGSLRSIFAAQSKAAIAGIDSQIEAEKKRDGKSKESLAKIQALEAKKEQMKKKQFEKDKKMKMAEIVINTASAIMGLWSGIKDPYVGPVIAGMQMALVGALGAAQLAVVAGTSYQGGGSVSTPSTPTSITAGSRKSTVDLAKSQSASGELAYLRGAQGTGGAENFTPAFMGAKYRAMGGATTGYVVGEQGPELFVPNTPGVVVPADDTASIGSVGSNVTFNINTIDATGVEELLTAQRGNIIGMLRESANSYGSGFFEEVDTSIYDDTTKGMAKA